MMKRYFFHLRNGRNVLLDDEGQALENAQAIKREAIREARAIVAADAASGLIDLAQWIEVHDESGTIILRLPFSEALHVKAFPSPQGFLP